MKCESCDESLPRLEIGDRVKILDYGNGCPGYDEIGYKWKQGVILGENLERNRDHQEEFYVKCQGKCRASFKREHLKKTGEEWFK